VKTAQAGYRRKLQELELGKERTLRPGCPILGDQATTIKVKVVVCDVDDAIRRVLVVSLIISIIAEYFRLQRSSAYIHQGLLGSFVALSITRYLF